MADIEVRKPPPARSATDTLPSWCQAHESNHDLTWTRVRIYEITTASGRLITLRLCDEMAMQLELLPLP